jgi:hypothetical protein
VSSEGQPDLLQERPTRPQRTPREWRVVGRRRLRRRAPVPCPRGDGGVAGFGGVGGLLFNLGEASEGRIIGRLPFRGSSTVLLLDQAHGELLRLNVGGRCSGSGSSFQGGGLGVGGAGGGAGHGAAQQEAGARVAR